MTDEGLSTCTAPACARPIRWAWTLEGRRLPLDPEPHPDGTVVHVDTPVGPRAKVLTGDELPAQQTAWRAHFTTCPASPQFKAREWRTAPKCAVCAEPMNATLARREGWTTHPSCDPRDGAQAARDAIRPTASNAGTPGTDQQQEELWP